MNCESSSGCDEEIGSFVVDASFTNELYEPE